MKYELNGISTPFGGISWNKTILKIVDFFIIGCDSIIRRDQLLLNITDCFFVQEILCNIGGDQECANNRQDNNGCFASLFGNCLCLLGLGTCRNRSCNHLSLFVEAEAYRYSLGGTCTIHVDVQGFVRAPEGRKVS